MKNFATHPLWSAGFRPFFILAALSGMALPILWVLVFSGVLTLPQATLSIFQWHGHEMFYGFGWAALGGFLLTATKNWVGIRGYYGKTLILLSVAWCVERVVLWYSGYLPEILFIAMSNFFLIALIALLMNTLITHQKSDSFRVDNRFLLCLLPLFIFAKNALLFQETFVVGWHMTLSLYRLVFLIILERTLTQFMRGAFQIQILRKPWLDNSIKTLALLLVFTFLLPSSLSGVLYALLGILLLYRLIYWAPLKACTRLDIGIMYVGYFFLSLQVWLEGAMHLKPQPLIEAIYLHIFTFGVMGLLIPAMMMRVSKGHTGHPVVFYFVDKLVLWIMMAAFVLRIVLPQILPTAYFGLIHAAATAWFVSFGVIAWRYIPILLQARQAPPTPLQVVGIEKRGGSPRPK